jgi:predicted transcriptional regulator
MAQEITSDGRVLCPLCDCYVHLLRIHKAADLVDVDRRSIYRYIEEGSVYAIKVAGHTYRVCGNCLLVTAQAEEISPKAKKSDKM